MPPAGPRLLLLGGMAVLIAAIGWVIASHPELYRLLFAIGLVSVLGLAALRWPTPTILALFIFLPVLGLLRRLLISTSGWPEIDPLLLVAPMIGLVLFAKAYLLESRPLVPDLLSKLVLGFVGIVVLAYLNPLGAGLVTGATALMLTAIPLLWFFIGRALPDRITIARLQTATAFLAGAAALYGLYQTEVGFPSWDLAWVQVGGYNSLAVGEELRGWGTLASASEYAGYLGAGIVFAVAAALHRRTWPLAILPLLTVGLLFSSVRGTLVLALFAIAVMLGIRSSRPRIALPVIAVLGLVAYIVAAPVLASVSSQTGSDLVSHQLEGVARPFDEDESTLDEHLSLIGGGFSESLRNPLGRGLAPVSDTATGESSASGGGTEFDFSDAFVKYGLPGGLLFLALAGVAIFTVGRQYLMTRDHLLLGALGLTVLMLGNWQNGGHYVITPLLWLMLGWATRPRDAEDGPAAARASP